MTSESEKHYIKQPVFRGEKKEWDNFKVKVESYLARKGMRELLNWDEEVPLDTETWTEEQLEEEANTLRKKIQSQEE